jgi:hypothetical protein
MNRFLELLKNHFYKMIYFCLTAIFLVTAACSKKNLYKDNKEYKYRHYPNSYRVPDSIYYGKPYELTPKKKYPYTDFDSYYVLPYGYDRMETGSDAFLKS